MPKDQMIKLGAAVALLLGAIVIFLATRGAGTASKLPPPPPPPSSRPASAAAKPADKPVEKPVAEKPAEKPVTPPQAPAAAEPKFKEVTEKYPTGELRRKFVVYTNKTEVKNGPYVEFHKSGNKSCEVEFKDNLPAGLLRCWYDAKEPVKALEGKFEGGKKNGPFTEWHQNGKKKFSYTYKDGVLNGSWVEFYENETKKAEMTYKGGVPVGVVKQYKPNGAMKYERILE